MSGSRGRPARRPARNGALGSARAFEEVAEQGAAFLLNATVRNPGFDTAAAIVTLRACSFVP